MRANTYQVLLIVSGVVVSALFGAFFYRELFPEYKIYQKDYVALEEFRSTYTHQPLPPFKEGIKQIVIEREDKGPAFVDRCTSCHVALQIPYFSPTKIAHDLNGNIIKTVDGHPLLIPNEDYIWKQLEEKIIGLKDPKVIESLKAQGDTAEIKHRLEEAERYEALKVAHVGEHEYDVTKVLSMHPLMGKETRPFEFHPIEEYGCTTCHSGNGRGLVSDKAHGPVFDGDYGIEDLGHELKFLESDSENDPLFARVFNHKPGHELLFQTEPLLVGSLLQAKCVQCHQRSDVQLTGVAESTSKLAQQRLGLLKTLTTTYEKEKEALADLLKLHLMMSEKGYDETINYLKANLSNYILPAAVLENNASQIKYIEHLNQKEALEKINQELVAMIGSDALVQILENEYKEKGTEAITPFLEKYQSDPTATGRLFVTGKALDLNQELALHAEEVEQSFSSAVKDPKLMSALTSDVDVLTQNFQRGQELYISQACYACHRIGGFSRGGVGPELTKAGDLYPWYMKRKLKWPQGDLATSTMPNMRLDHVELQDLMTFLFAQKGGNQAVSKTNYQAGMQAWEAGKKMAWEKPIAPSQMYDLRYAMTTFAVEGCAACHRLKGFESNVGFKESTDEVKLSAQKQWFKKIFPEVVHYGMYDEELPGSELVDRIEKNAQEIDQIINPEKNKNGLIEEIDAKHPEVIESLYSPFRYASRAKDNHFKTLISQETDAAKIEQLKKEWKEWKERVHRVLMIYIETYGLGRLIGPHLNWSGIYRSDEWLMEHFKNPTGHVPRSIMPVFPFDETKFYSLTYMLDKLGVRNRNEVRQQWNVHGFNPKEAFEMLCAQCHGIDLYGNGAIAEWIYPIPKNLHNPEFLRNLTREKVIYSIQHGVQGTPMPPWGEVAENKQESIQKISGGVPVLNEAEIEYLVDWLFSSLPGGEVIKDASDVQKWDYTAEDVIKELKNENEQLDFEKINPTAGIGFKIQNSYASFFPLAQVIMNPKIEPLDVESVFDILPDPMNKDKKEYFIKKKYYTARNIEEGSHFFLLNCAVCHGTEGDGSGARSTMMKDAKPRMLSNLDWIRSKDDLRLLQSIKYGVPGTSMTPWGDLTSSLQRLQLVMFIRTLSQEKDLRDRLDEALFQTYEPEQLIIENARIEGSQDKERLQVVLKDLKEEQIELQRGVSGGKIEPAAASKVYEAILENESKINQLQLKDEEFLRLRVNLKRERDLYYSVGIALIGKNLGDAVFTNYLEMIRLTGKRDELKVNVDKIRALRDRIVAFIESKIKELEKQLQSITDQMATKEKKEEMGVIQGEIDGLKKIKGRLITDSEEALRLAEK